jgi:hypothetical protein
MSFRVPSSWDVDPVKFGCPIGQGLFNLLADRRFLQHSAPRSVGVLEVQFPH